MGWTPWIGCYKESDGCTYCYHYGPYSKNYGNNTVYRANDNQFYKPLETVYMPRKKITKYVFEAVKL